MPIEIRELVIKATINGETQQNGGASDGQAANSTNNAMLVEQCVASVLAILRKERER